MKKIIPIFVLAVAISSTAIADTFVDTVKASTDDMSYLAGNAGSVVTTSNAIIGNGSGGGWQLGFRFQNVTIAQGSTIDSAFVSYYAGDTDSLDDVSVTLACEDTNDAAAFSDSTDFKARILTSSTTNVTMTANTTGNERFYLLNSSNGLKADYKSPIQEVINRASWSSGNDLVVFVNDNSSTSGAYRLARTYDHGTSEGAYLHIYYSAGGSPAQPDSLNWVAFDSLHNDFASDSDSVVVMIYAPAQTADSIKLRVITGASYPSYSTGTLYQYDYPTAGDTVYDTLILVTAESYTLRARAWAYYDSASPDTSIHVQDSIYFSAGSSGTVDVGEIVEAFKGEGFVTLADSELFKAWFSGSISLPDSIIEKIIYSGTDTNWISKTDLDSIIDYRIDSIMTAKWQEYGNKNRIIRLK